MIVLFIFIKQRYGTDEYWVKTDIGYDEEFYDWMEIETMVAPHIPDGYEMHSYKWQMVSDQ